MDNITKFELKLKNSVAMKKTSLTLSITDAEHLLKEIDELKQQLPSMSHEQDQTLYIELDGGTF